MFFLYRIQQSIFFILFCLLIAAPVAQAKQMTKQQVAQKLAAIFGDVNPKDILLIDSEVKDFYIMRFKGDFGLVSKDGKYYLAGEAWNLDKRENLTAGLRKEFNLSTLKNLDAENLITFNAKNEKTSVWVFTDIDCFYCRKLHAEITELNDLGVTVNYLSFPRSGSPTERDWAKAIDVWCSKDQRAAMTASKKNESIRGFKKVANCSPEIDKQYQTGTSLGIRGTPAIIMPNGTLVGGYLPAKELARTALGNQ
jgi:thiol:disulfide interchange protein DsbC